jgi:hypothetical protein
MDIETSFFANTFLKKYSRKNDANFLINMIFLYNEVYLNIFDFKFDKTKIAFLYLLTTLIKTLILC